MNINSIPDTLIVSLDYLDGELHWVDGGRADLNHGVKYKHGGEYRYVAWKGVKYMAHRVVWAMHNGDTEQILDHINRRKDDNRIENLRLSDHSENGKNAGPPVITETAEVESQRV